MKNKNKTCSKSMAMRRARFVLISMIAVLCATLFSCVPSFAATDDWAIHSIDTKDYYHVENNGRLETSVVLSQFICFPDCMIFAQMRRFAMA